MTRKRVLRGNEEVHDPLGLKQDAHKIEFNDLQRAGEKLGDIEFRVRLEKLWKESGISPISSKGELISFEGRTPFGEP